MPEFQFFDRSNAARLVRAKATYRHTGIIFFTELFTKILDRFQQNLRLFWSFTRVQCSSCIKKVVHLLLHFALPPCAKLCILNRKIHMPHWQPNIIMIIQKYVKRMLICFAQFWSPTIFTVAGVCIALTVHVCHMCGLFVDKIKIFFTNLVGAAYIQVQSVLSSSQQEQTPQL